MKNKNRAYQNLVMFPPNERREADFLGNVIVYD
jgi:hypothetical protein